MEVECDGQRYRDQEFVVLRQASLAERLQQVWD